MTDQLETVEQAAERLKLHPKTVLRFIREGRLAATKVGRAYRISRRTLDAFAGVAIGALEAGSNAAKATCIVDVPEISVAQSERIATFLNALAMTGGAGAEPLTIQTAYDSQARSMKAVLIGGPGEVGQLLEMLQVRLRDLG